MLWQAQREFSLDLTRTVFFADDERDGEAARAAGCRWVRVSEDKPVLQVTREWLETQSAGLEPRNWREDL